MRRGDLVTAALPGDLGKPRPALVIQADAFIDHATLTVLPITSALVDAPLLRVTVEPTAENCLEKSSQVMVDKSITVRREKLGTPFGHLEDSIQIEIDRRLAVFLGIAA